MLVIVPVSFASDNSTITQDGSDVIGIVDDYEIESSSNSDLSPVCVDYYFNSSSEVDGDGSIDNPYNKISTTRLKSSSTIHLANGEYTLSSSKGLEDVEIIGEDAQNTILRYDGTAKTARFTLGIENYLTLKNITLVGFNIDLEGATLQATNTIFKNAVAFSTYSSATDLVNSASNSFGGAIYAYYGQDNYDTYYPMVILENCTFINNTAEYGGAIFMDSGTLDITNSIFSDNYAYNYGGAIASVYGASVRVKNSKFINDYSINDAGGAFYLLRSTLSANNVSVINCSATFGPAITSLNSTVAVIYLDAINNTAKYEGGAIYQIYNAISISDSNFINNSARNGGAVYIDDVEIFKMIYNNFESNIASNTAGAVYSMLVPSINENNNNNYTNNKAKTHDDFYQSEGIILTIGNGNYTLYYNDNVFNGTLPDSYDLRDYDLVTPVKDQQSGGNCWAFASTAALESAILKASGKVLDLSEENMKNLMQLYSDYGWTGIETNNGGYDEMAISYFTSWLGPVYESIEQYDDYSMLSPVLNSVTHVQDIIFLGRNTYTDNDAIKEAIIKYGAVSTGIYFDSSYYSYLKHSYYYYYGSNSANHAVAIVGWDDNYSASNFNYRPEGDGAWIVKNSWDSTWGENGYFYVSYYDNKLAQVGIPDYSYAFVFNSTARYDKNYQYDIIGMTDYFVTGEKTIWVENVFDATDNELLAAVSTMFRKVTDWELFVYLNNELVVNKNGTSNPGYWTIDFGEYIPVASGDQFRVVFKLFNENGAEFGISEKISANKLSYSPGISFFSLDGENWTDLYDYEFTTEEDGEHYYFSQVACIKAFTILYELKPTLELTYSSVYNTVNFIAVVHDQYENLVRSGEIIFNIEGANQTFKIENGIVNITYTFANKGNYNISAAYKNANESVSVDIERININLVLEIIKDKNNVVLNLESLFDVNSNVSILVNDVNYNISLENGKASLNLDDLDFGYYELLINVIDEDYACDIQSEFNITIIKTIIVADDFITYYQSENPFSIVLRDVNGNPVVNRKVSFIVDGKSYVGTTDENGVASSVIKLDKSSYRIDVLFYGDESYFNASKILSFDVKSTIDGINSAYISTGVLSVKILNTNGKALQRSQVNIRIDNVDYWLITDNDGLISQSLNLKAGTHTITVNNLETGETVSKSVTVVAPIMENKDVSMYYGANKYFQVRVYGSDAKPVGSGNIVKIQINGKAYNVKTDSKGYAKLKLSFKANKYTITATYNGFKVSNKVVIKPVLTAKNISKKKAKKIKFSSKLVNTNGKALKGKKITFKINKKTYKAKTNKKGIAKITIKNLKVGKYKITTKYGKSTIKNTIKIK